MRAMSAPVFPTAILAGLCLAGLPWLRQASTAPGPPSPSGAAVAVAAVDAPDRVEIVAADAPAYRALAIPRSYRTSPQAPMRLLVFRGGLCIADRGLRTEHTDGGTGRAGEVVVEESGITERAAASPDGREAVVATTRYISRVDMSPGVISDANDSVQGSTTLTLIDPRHPDGRWTLTLEEGRWMRDLAVFPGSMGVAVTTFRPRNGPTDLRVLDANGRETARIPEGSAETLRIEPSADGRHLAAEVAFPESAKLPQRGIVVFDLLGKSQWTYGWRYGAEDEPVSWTLGETGVLSVSLAGGTKRFDATGRPK